jgi:hypothetical protein
LTLRPDSTKSNIPVPTGFIDPLFKECFQWQCQSLERQNPSAICAALTTFLQPLAHLFAKTVAQYSVRIQFAEIAELTKAK